MSMEPVLETASKTVEALRCLGGRQTSWQVFLASSLLVRKARAFLTCQG